MIKIYSDCEHPSTVEVFAGIVKCTRCGYTWDETTPPEKIKRIEDALLATRARERRDARIKSIIRRRRYGR